MENKMTDTQKALDALQAIENDLLACLDQEYAYRSTYSSEAKKHENEYNYVKEKTSTIRSALEAKAVDVEEVFQEFMDVLEDKTTIPNAYANLAAHVLSKHLAANGYLPKPDHTDHIADDILSIVKYTGNDLEGFNRFIGAARMCGYDLVRKGKPLAPDHTGLLREAFMECFEELIGIYDFYHPSGRGEGDLSNAKRILSKHNNFYEKQAALGEK
jgi:hypothetical protein